MKVHQRKKRWLQQFVIHYKEREIWTGKGIRRGRGRPEARIQHPAYGVHLYEGSPPTLNLLCAIHR